MYVHYWKTHHKNLTFWDLNVTVVMHPNCKGYSTGSIVNISGQRAISNTAPEGDELGTDERVRIREGRTKMNERGDSSRREPGCAGRAVCNSGSDFPKRRKSARLPAGVVGSPPPRGGSVGKASLVRQRQTVISGPLGPQGSAGGHLHIPCSGNTRGLDE